MSELDLDDVAATSPKAMAELAALRKDLEQHKRAVEVLFEDDPDRDLDYIKWYIRQNVLKAMQAAP